MNEQVYSEFYKKYWNLVFSTILYMVKNKECAEDIAQDVFIKLFDKLDTFRGESKIETWIIKITRNFTIDYIKRKNKINFVNLDNISDLLSISNESYNELDLDYINKKIKIFIEELSPKRKKIFKLFISDMKMKNIANIMSLSYETVKVQCFLAKHEIQKKIKKIL